MAFEIFGYINNLDELGFGNKKQSRLVEFINKTRDSNTFISDSKIHVIKNIIFGNYSLFVLTESQEVFHYGFRDEMFQFTFKSCFKAFEPIVNIISHWGITVILVESNRCFIWKNFDMDKTPQQLIFKPQFENDKKIKAIAMGDFHNILITTGGKLYNINFKKNTTAWSNFEVDISEISCGNEHVMLLSKNGIIYTYGLGNHSQLGHGTTDKEDVPKIVESLEGIKIIAISAGGWHSVALSEIGDVYTWGWNESSQLGIAQSGTSPIILFQPISRLLHLPFEIPIKAIATGSRHTVVLLENGEVWGWGYNKYGQLIPGGPDTIESAIKLGTKVPARSIQCHGWSTCVIPG